MPTLHPFAGYYVNPARAGDVVGPPYDQLTPQERAEFAASHPDNYINTMRSLEEFPPESRPDIHSLLRGNAAKLEVLLHQGAFIRVSQPALFLYRLEQGGHCQTGVVAGVDIDDYAQGRIKRHEYTRTDHEDNLTLYHEIVGASSSPVCTTYPADAAIDALIEDLCRRLSPVLDFTMEDGVRQTVWCIESDDAIKHTIQAFAGITETYLTDGHHRAASGWRHAQKQRQANPGYTGDEPFNRLLVALFPHDQLRILAFNRCVKETNDLDEAGLLSAVSRDFDWEKLPGPAEPAQPGEFVIVFEDNWYRLKLHAPDSTDPVKILDVSRLHDYLLQPVLGIHDMRSDPRLGYVPGSLGCQGMMNKIREGWRLGILCHPTSIEELMAVADADAVMPPKSTWFDPKVRSGVFLSLHR